MNLRFASLDQQWEAEGELVPIEVHRSVATWATRTPSIPRGAGLAYVGASFGQGVRSLDCRRNDRVLSFAPADRRITVEAGMSLGRLYDVVVKHGLYLPVQPGHPQITIGACVACNVHGKNPRRDGTFSAWVESLRLIHPDHGVLALSRSDSPEVFDLTIGGLGLTGVIADVTLRLAPLPSTLVESDRLSVGSIAEACQRVTEAAESADFVFSWNDASVFDSRLGRGYVAAGRFATDDAQEVRLPDYRRLDPVAARHRVRPRIFRRQTIPTIANLQRVWQKHAKTTRLPLYEVLYPGLPFDRYYDLYGRRGFWGHQVLIPAGGVAEFVQRLESSMRRHREPILIVSLKSFGGSPSLLRYDGDGVSFHFHIPKTAGGHDLLSAIESDGGQLGGIRLLYVDSRLTAEGARTCFPEYPIFRKRLHQFDPRRRFRSALSERLEL